MTYVPFSIKSVEITCKARTSMIDINIWRIVRTWFMRNISVRRELRLMNIRSGNSSEFDLFCRVYIFMVILGVAGHHVDEVWCWLVAFGVAVGVVGYLLSSFLNSLRKVVNLAFISFISCWIDYQTRRLKHVNQIEVRKWF